MRDRTLDVLLCKTAGYLEKLKAEEAAEAAIEEKKMMDKARRELNAMAGARNPLTKTKELNEDFVRQLVRASHDAPLEQYTLLPEGDIGPHMWQPHPLDFFSKIPFMTKMQDAMVGEQHAEKHRAARDAGENILALNPGRNPGVIAHEIGHSTRPGVLDKITYHGNAVTSNPLLLGSGLLSMLAGAVAGKPSLVAVGAVPTLLSGAFTLAEESRATRRGKELLNRIGYTPSENELKSLDAAYRSHLVGEAQQLGLPISTLLMSLMTKYR